MDKIDLSQYDEYHYDMHTTSVFVNDLGRSFRVEDTIRPKSPDHNDASIITYGAAIFNAVKSMDIGIEYDQSGYAIPAEDKPINTKLFISGKHNFISRQYER